MENKRWKIILGICVVVAIALWASTLKTKTQREIRIATNPWPGFEFVHLADRKGFFKEEGLNVKLLRFGALEDARHAFERKQADGMLTTVIEVLQANEHGSPALPVFLIDFSNGSDVIVVQKNIKNIADLKGKKVGVELATLSGFIMTRALEKSGLSLDDVIIEGLNPIAMQDALLSGKVAAVHVYPPYSTELMRNSENVVKIFDSSEIPGEIVDLLSLSPEIVNNHPEDVAALRRAWNKAVAYARAHPEEANIIMAEYEKITPQEFAEALKGVKIMNMEEQMPLIQGGTFTKGVEAVERILHKAGELKKPVNADELLTAIKGVGNDK